MERKEKKQEGFYLNYLQRKKVKFLLDLLQKLKRENEEFLEEILQKDKLNKQLSGKIEDLNQIYEAFLETKQKVSFLNMSFKCFCDRMNKFFWKKKKMK